MDNRFKKELPNACGLINNETWTTKSLRTSIYNETWNHQVMPVDLSIMRLGTTKSLYKNFNNETWNHQVMPVDLYINNETWNHQVIKNFNNETWNHQVIIYIYTLFRPAGKIRHRLLLEAHGEAFANLFSQSFVFVLLRVYTLTTRVVQGGENSNCLYI